MDPNDYRIWLDAEESGRDELAELMFARLLSDLPTIEPSPAFASAVANRAWRVARRRRAANPLARVAATLLVLGATAVTMYALGMVVVDALARSTALLSQAVLWFVASAAHGVQWWAVMARVGAAIGASLLTVRTATAIGGIELLGAMAIYLFQRVLHGEPHAHNSPRVQI
jgi:hypothetical protein